MAEIVGKQPSKPPPRTLEFDELEKRMVDILIDSIKYIATTAGITIAVYSQIIQEHLKSSAINSSALAKFLLFMPLVFWLLTIVATVIGIFPRSYKAVTDLEKQEAVNSIRRTKAIWLSAVMLLFVAGFATFVYVISAQIWGLYPFKLLTNP